MCTQTGLTRICIQPCQGQCTIYWPLKFHYGVNQACVNFFMMSATSAKFSNMKFYTQSEEWISMCVCNFTSVFFWTPYDMRSILIIIGKIYIRNAVHRISFGVVIFNTFLKDEVVMLCMSPWINSSSVFKIPLTFVLGHAREIDIFSFHMSPQAT
jgi:hypothetical protein